MHLQKFAGGAGEGFGVAKQPGNLLGLAPDLADIKRWHGFVVWLPSLP